MNKLSIKEIETSLNLLPISDDFEKISTAIIFSTIIELKENLTNKTEIEKIILIKVPNEIYPEIRSLFILLFEKSGFSKIKIEKKIDFKDLYLKRTIQ